MADIRQLRSLLAVAEHGSFSGAAEALFTVQSNVSAHVARLESDVGHVLLDRRSRSLTQAGEIVAGRARTVLAELAAINDDLAALEARIVGAVRCGATPAVGSWLLPPAVARAAEQLPEVSVTVVEAQSDELFARLARSDLDLAVTTGGASTDFVQRALFDEEVVAVVDPDHALAGKRRVTLSQLAEYRLLLPLPDNPLHRLIEQTFSMAGERPPPRTEIGSSSLSVRMALEGVGVALVPASAAGGADRAVLSIEGMAPRRVALTQRATASAAAVELGRIIADVAMRKAADQPGCQPLDPAGTN